MKFMTSLIVVEDIEKSRHFYENILGQKVKEDYGENVTFVGDFSIHKKSHFNNLIGDRPIIERSNNFELYFEHDDLIPVEDTIEKLGLEFVHKIVEQPWKQRVIRFYDYDKNLIEIGETLEHVAYRLSKENYSLEEISKTTYLSVDCVKKAIDKYS